MASSRKSPPAEVDAPIAALRDALAALRPRHAGDRPLRVAIALSGGRDSMVLLHAAVALRGELDVELSATHVHHGLCADADAWTVFCAAECAARDVALEIARVTIDRRGGESLEAAARDARYAVLRQVKADVVALAHHADDQAETVLLQLARGAGPHGLAAMPQLRDGDDGPRMLRPFIELPSAVLAAYAYANTIAWIDDPSNCDRTLRRNALRYDVVPHLRTTFPGYPATLVRAARHQAECARLLDDLAAIDGASLVVEHAPYGPALDRRALAELARQRPDRARNVLRWFLRTHALPPPSAARLEALLAQCASRREDARVKVLHAGVVLESHRGCIVLHAPAQSPFECEWRGEDELVLPAGTLTATRTIGNGLATGALLRDPMRVASRRGGERLRVVHGAPPRSVGAWLAKTAMPSWHRERWPLVWSGDTLVAVPGLGVDPEFAAGDQAAGCVLSWTPGDAPPQRSR